MKMQSLNGMSERNLSNRITVLFLTLCFFLLLGCVGSVDESDNTDNWPVTAVYTFEYDDQGRELVEYNDNNNDGYTDVTFLYRYDETGKLLGYDLTKDGVPYTGTYQYNATGFPAYLIQTSGDKSKQAVWSYLNDAAGNKLSYTYDDGDEEKTTAQYTYEKNGGVIKLATNKQETWKYTVDSKGKPQTYTYSLGANETVQRVGTYEYNDKGQVVRLIHKSRP